MKNKHAGTVLSFVGVGVITLVVAVVLIILVDINAPIDSNVPIGSNVPRAFSSFITGIFGSLYSISEVVVRATPLIFAGLGISVGLRSGFINIGAEGQLYMGAIAATAIALSFSQLPAIIIMPMMILGGFLLGGLWALIPGFLKARFGLSEVISTIMFNYVAINIVGVLVRTVLQDPAHAFPQSAFLPDSALLSTFFPIARVHTGIIIACACAVLTWLLMWKTPTGFKLRAVGLNSLACKVAGIRVYKHVILAAILSGGLAGLAGLNEVAGIHRRFIEGFSPNYGYIAIVVALLGKSHPVGVVLAALGIAALDVGSIAMQRVAGVPSAISLIIKGVLVLLILGRKYMFRISAE